MRKRLLASLLCLCLLVGVLPATALAAGTGPELNISGGSIIITETGYKVGDGTETLWGDNSDHALTITGESSGSNNIVVQGGNPVITLKNVTMSMTSGNLPAILLYGGTGNGESRAADATIVLEGSNTLTSNGAPAVQININATLTIQGDGVLNASSSRGNTSGIGAGDGNAYAYTDTDGNAATHNNYRSGGNLVVKSGTVNATGNGTGTGQYVAGIGDSYYANFGNVTIEGGTVTVDNNNGNGTGISGDAITIKGGVVKDLTGGSRGGIHTQESFTMSGGTLSGNATLRGSTTVSITGGNVGGYFAGTEKDSRELTKLYFFNADGTPSANAEVTVTEGDGPAWTALTDENGVITTYLASTTATIQATVGEGQEEEITITDGLGVVGASCTCATIPAP